MIHVIKRFIKLLHKFNLIKKVHIITYKGQGVSLNKFYSVGHWSTRSNIKTKYRKIFDKLVADQGLEWMNTYSVIIFYNSRHDPDNVIGMEKVFIDALKQDEAAGRDGYIADDSKRYCKLVAVVPNSRLDMNTFEFMLIKHS